MTAIKQRLILLLRLSLIHILEMYGRLNKDQEEEEETEAEEKKVSAEEK